MKKLLVCALALIMTLSLSAAFAADYSDVFTNFDQRDSWTQAVTIAFSDDGVLINGSGAAADGTVVYITAPGTYMLTGSCQNGRIEVEVPKEEKVQLVLGGLTLTCTESAPLYVISADKVSITLTPGSVNTFTDGSAYTVAYSKAPNACIYSRDDLTINGTGELIVNGNYNNGIGCSNDLKIVGGTITVNALNNALKGNDSVSIREGTLTIHSQDDGIKSNNADEAGKGYVYIAGGSITITAGDDAIQASQDVTIAGGSITVNAEGKTINSKGTQDVARGVIQ